MRSDCLREKHNNPQIDVRICDKYIVFIVESRMFE